MFRSAKERDMSDGQTITIPRSKAKLAFALLVCLFAVVFGVWCVLKPASFGYKPTALIIILGVVVIALFVFFAFCAVKWLFNNTPGLLVSAEGIVDNTVAGTENKILWRDVADITQWSYVGQKLVVVVLKDPHCYIDGCPSSKRRKAMLMNLQTCGSPVAISASVLKISHRKLYALLRDNFVKYTSPSGN